MGILIANTEVFGDAVKVTPIKHSSPDFKQRALFRTYGSDPGGT